MLIIAAFYILLVLLILAFFHGAAAASGEETVPEDLPRQPEPGEQLELGLGREFVRAGR